MNVPIEHANLRFLGSAFQQKDPEEAKLLLQMSDHIFDSMTMLFREFWSQRAPLWTSCLRYRGDFNGQRCALRCTYHTEDAVSTVTDHVKCALVRLQLAKQHKEVYCTFVCRLKLSDVYDMSNFFTNCHFRDDESVFEIKLFLCRNFSVQRYCSPHPQPTPFEAF